MKRILFITAITAILFAASSCSEQKKRTSSPGKLSVFASILPEAYLINRIGGDYVETGVMVPKGQDPHNYAPTPNQIMRLGNAVIYFEVGMPLEKSIVQKIKDGSSKIKFVDVSKGIKRRAMCGSEVECSHKHEHKHDNNEGADPHVWNSIPNLEIMAKNICRELAEADPGNANSYNANLKKLLKELKSLNRKIKEILVPYKGRTFLVFHPAFGYFADCYGLKQEAVEIEGKSPAPKQIAKLIKKARSDNVKIIFVEPQFNPKSAEAIARSIGGAVVFMDPLPENPIKNFMDIAEKLKRAFSGKK